MQPASANGRWLCGMFDKPSDALLREGGPGRGDGVGPVLVQAEGDLSLAGLTPWSDRQGAVRMPGRYGQIARNVRLSHYKAWIESVHFCAGGSGDGPLGSSKPDPRGAPPSVASGRRILIQALGITNEVPVARGYKFALVTLAVELALALLLASRNFGLFALMAMPFVGIAWLPAAIMMLSDLKRDAVARALPSIAAVLCFAAGAVCLAVSARWVAVAIFVQ